MSYEIFGCLLLLWVAFALREIKFYLIAKTFLILLFNLIFKFSIQAVNIAGKIKNIWNENRFCGNINFFNAIRLHWNKSLLFGVLQLQFKQTAHSYKLDINIYTGIYWHIHWYMYVCMCEWVCIWFCVVLDKSSIENQF